MERGGSSNVEDTVNFRLKALQGWGLSHWGRAHRNPLDAWTSRVVVAVVMTPAGLGMWSGPVRIGHKDWGEGWGSLQGSAC